MTTQVLLPVREQLTCGATAMGLMLSTKAEDGLLAYLALLDKWNRVYNLTAVRETERMVSHHLLDSLAILPHLQADPAFPLPNPDGTTSHSTKPANGQVAGYLPLAGEAADVMSESVNILDVGSGGGLPGIPLAIIRPDLQVTLIDSVAKKTAFLLQVKAELGLNNLSVVTGRVEAHQPATPFNTITSRAFSDLKEFVTLTRHLLAPGGRWLAMKGLYPHEEIAQLPAWVRLSAEHVLTIPGLDATRHLIILEPV